MLNTEEMLTPTEWERKIAYIDGKQLVMELEKKVVEYMRYQLLYKDEEGMAKAYKELEMVRSRLLKRLQWGQI